MTASIKRGALELHQQGHRALLLGQTANFLRRRQGLRLSDADNIQEYLLCQRLLHGEAGELEACSGGGVAQSAPVHRGVLGEDRLKGDAQVLRVYVPHRLER